MQGEQPAGEHLCSQSGAAELSMAACVAQAGNPSDQQVPAAADPQPPPQNTLQLLKDSTEQPTAAVLSLALKAYAAGQQMTVSDAYVAAVDPDHAHEWDFARFQVACLSPSLMRWTGECRVLAELPVRVLELFTPNTLHRRLH